MTKRNRRQTTCHVKLGFIIVVVFTLLAIAPWIAYSVLLLSADQVSNEIKRLEQTQREQEASLIRVSAVWNQMTEPQRLSEKINERGLVMKVAAPDRQVRIQPNSNRLIMSQKLRNELAEVRKQKQEAIAATSSQKRLR